MFLVTISEMLHKENLNIRSSKQLVNETPSAWTVLFFLNKRKNEKYGSLSIGQLSSEIIPEDSRLIEIIPIIINKRSLKISDI